MISAPQAQKRVLHTHSYTPPPMRLSGFGTANLWRNCAGSGLTDFPLSLPSRTALGLERDDRVSAPGGAPLQRLDDLTDIEFVTRGERLSNCPNLIHNRICSHVSRLHQFFRRANHGRRQPHLRTRASISRRTAALARWVQFQVNK
jgi:hypothetical protein